MTNVQSVGDLKKAIQDLESRALIQEQVLKDQFHETLEEFKPSNILKHTVSEVSASPEFRHNLLNTALGIGAGYLTNKLVVGKKAGMLMKLAGTAVQFAVSNLVVKKAHDDPSTIEKGKNIFRRIFKRKMA